MTTHLKLLFITLCLIYGCNAPADQPITSPDGLIEVRVFVTDQNTIGYSVNHEGKPVILESDLGLELSQADFTRYMDIQSRSPVTVYSDSYSLQVGKKRDITYMANEQIITVVNADRQQMDIVFRVSNDGVAFRYSVNDPSITDMQFTSESSSFRFAADTRAWLQPIAEAQTGWSNTNPSYEEFYEIDIPVGTPSTLGAGWVFPALFHSNGSWALISETGLSSNWHASRLYHDSSGGEYKIDGPQAPEVFTGGGLLAYSESELVSPWRLIAIGSLETIMESTLGTDLARPAIDMDMDFIQPGHASWSWAILKDESVNFDVQKEFIDYAADMQWDYTLIDVNWDSTIGYERLQELADYGNQMDVGVLVWFNSSGDWNITPYTPKSELLKAEQRADVFSRLSEIGVKGVKIDFFSGDGQSMIAYYEELMSDAADYGLLVNFHGATLPRGWHRTYPNLMTMESIRGFEFATFGQDGQDRVISQVIMSLFTRNVFDPMDFTPVVFGDIPNIERVTENSFELAQSILMTSGIQHFAETAEGMETVPEYVKDFLRDLPREWDDMEYIQGYPGETVVIARRSGESWYIAGINASPDSVTISPDISFLGERSGYLISSGDTERSFSRKTITGAESHEMTLREAAGFVMVFE